VVATLGRTAPQSEARQSKVIWQPAWPI